MCSTPLATLHPLFGLASASASPTSAAPFFLQRQVDTPRRLGRAWLVTRLRAMGLNPSAESSETCGGCLKVERLRTVEYPAPGHIAGKSLR